MNISVPTPFGKTLYFLGSFTFITVVYTFMKNGISSDLLFHFTSIIGFSALPIILFTKIFKQTVSPEQGMSIALLFFLILDYQFGWQGYLFGSAAVFIGLFIQYFFFIKGQPVLDSISASILAILALAPFISKEKYDITWWGLQLPDITIGSLVLPLTTLLLLGWLYMNIAKWEKIHLILFFYCSAFLFLGFFRYGIGNIQEVLMSPILLFIILFLFTNPRTSPSEQKSQIAAGIFGGFLFAFFLTQGGVPSLISSHPALAATLVTSIAVFIGKIIKK